MAQYNSSFNNLVNTVQPMTGEQTIHVDQIDFDTSCPCQMTACDGGTIKVCAKMEVEDLVIDNLCLDGKIGCDSLVLKTGSTNGIKFDDDPCATPQYGPRLFENTALHLVAPSSKPLNVQAAANINTETVAGNVNIKANQGTQPQSINLTTDRVNIAALLNLPVGVYINDHPRYYGNGSRGTSGDKRGDIRINAQPATTTIPSLVGALYVCIEDYEDVSPPTGKAIWGRISLNSW